MLTDSWVDDNGYSYEIEVNTPTATITPDIANAKPGEVVLTWNYAFTGILANTTSGRVAPEPGVKLSPMWPSSSVLCSTALVGYTAFSTNDDLQDQWCSLPSAPYDLVLYSGKLPVDGVREITATGSQGLPLAVPEAQVDAIVAEMRNPTAWALGRDSGEGSTHCLLDTGIYITASTPGFSCSPL